MWVRGSPTHRTGLGGRPFRPQSGKPIKATGAQITPGAGCKDMITVKTLARAIEKRLGGTSSEALAEARTVMSYFGFRAEIIDNAIQPEDRKSFYSIHDAGPPHTIWATVPLPDGRDLRIFYWALTARN